MAKIRGFSITQWLVIILVLVPLAVTLWLNDTFAPKVERLFERLERVISRE